MNQRLTPSPVVSAGVSAADAARFTGAQLRAVLTGQTDTVEIHVPAGVDPVSVRNKGNNLLRQIRDRALRRQEHAWSLEREHAVRCYIDPDRPRVVVCAATGHDNRKLRVYAPVLRLAVGESCLIESDGCVRSVHMRLSQIAKQVEKELGSRPAFNAAFTPRLGVYRITRLVDGRNPRFDPRNYGGPTLKDLEAYLEE